MISGFTYHFTKVNDGNPNMSFPINKNIIDKHTMFSPSDLNSKIQCDPFLFKPLYV